MPREPDVPPRSAVGVRDIARRLGVSVGTVDRALHDKPGIKQDTRARVLAAAEMLGYRPNLAARSLRARAPLRIAVQLPEQASFFWATLRDGISEAAAQLAPPPSVEFRSYAGAWDPTTAAGRGLDRGAGGLIVAPGDVAPIAPEPDDPARRRLPVVYVAGAIADRPRLLSVLVQPFSIGALAGELVARLASAGGPVAVVSSPAAGRTHAEAQRGFLSSLAMAGPRLKLAPHVESHADAAETQRRVRELLRAHPRLKGLYVDTDQALPVLEGVRQAGRLSGLPIVTHDLSPELFDWIRSGAVAATVYQRPLTQGHVALQLLYRQLQAGTPPTPQRQVVAPFAVMRSNLEIVLQRLDIARAAARPPEPHPASIEAPVVRG